MFKILLHSNKRKTSTHFKSVEIKIYLLLTFRFDGSHVDGVKRVPGRVTDMQDLLAQVTRQTGQRRGQQVESLASLEPNGTRVIGADGQAVGRLAMAC